MNCQSRRKTSRIDHNYKLVHARTIESNHSYWSCMSSQSLHLSEGSHEPGEATDSQERSFLEVLAVVRPRSPNSVSNSE